MHARIFIYINSCNEENSGKVGDRKVFYGGNRSRGGGQKGAANMTMCSKLVAVSANILREAVANKMNTI